MKINFAKIPNNFNTVFYRKIVGLTIKNSVIILFMIISGLGLFFAAQPANYIVGEISTRLFRNLILILSLVVPVWAGMGLNFSIVLGAMAAQAGVLFIINFGLSGFPGLIVLLFVSLLLAVILGILTGRLFNKVKGQEMITGMILAFFAKGVYELIFMYLAGSVIPVKNKQMLLPNGVGFNGVMRLDRSLNMVIDRLWRVSLVDFLMVFLIGSIVLFAVHMGLKFKKKMGIASGDYLRLFIAIVTTVCYIIAINISTSFYNILMFTKIPVVTALVIFLVCLFILFLSKSKLGNDIKIVGQSTQIAKSAGINVDRVRIKAVVISTVIAAIGQIVYLQSIGTFDTYSAHDQVGVFSVAALLVGGASISESNIGNAFIGAILFHVMFIVAPVAGKNLFGDAQIGEYFRVFFSYGIIAMALVLYAWKTSIKDKGNLKTK